MYKKGPHGAGFFLPVITLMQILLNPIINSSI